MPRRQRSGTTAAPGANAATAAVIDSAAAACSGRSTCRRTSSESRSPTVQPGEAEPVEADADAERALAGDGVEVAGGAVLAHLLASGRLVGRFVERPGEQALAVARQLAPSDQVARAVGLAAAARHAVGRAEVALFVALDLAVAAGGDQAEVRADLRAGLAEVGRAGIARLADADAVAGAERGVAVGVGRAGRADGALRAGAVDHAVAALDRRRSGCSRRRARCCRRRTPRTGRRPCCARSRRRSSR